MDNNPIRPPHPMESLICKPEKIENDETISDLQFHATEDGNTLKKLGLEMA